MNIQLPTGQEVLIDEIDADLAQFHWRAKPKKYTYYAQRNITVDGKRTTHFLHRIIAERAGFGDCPQVDHKNGNGLDCRRENLRPATPSQNVYNSRTRSDNVSGVRGVSWSTRDQHWLVQISVDKKRLRLGTFKDLDEATRVRREAEVRYFKEFRKTP